MLGHALVMSLWYFGVFIKPAVKRFWEVEINTLWVPRKMTGMSRLEFFMLVVTLVFFTFEISSHYFFARHRRFIQHSNS